MSPSPLSRWRYSGAQRLEVDGIVDRRVMPTAPATVEYELTDLGRELLPAVDAIVEVGHRLKQRRSTNGSN